MSRPSQSAEAEEGTPGRFTPPSSLPVFGVVDSLLGVDDKTPRPVRDQLTAARDRAALLAATIGDAGPAEQLGAIVYASGALAAVWLDGRWDGRAVDDFIAGLARPLAAGRDGVRTALFSQCVCERELLELPPQLCAETILQMLCAFSGAAFASLWTENSDGRLSELVQVGEGASSRRARAAAGESIEQGRVVTSERNLLHSIPVQRWGRRAAALVFRCRPELRPRAFAFATAAAAALVPVMEFDALLARNAQREQSLTEASERRLTRLGFDLHDGALQDIAALASDLRLFRSQLLQLIGGHRDSEIVVGRVDDLEARLVALDGDLRELTRSIQTPAGMRISLADAIEHEVADFRRRAEIAATFSTTGGFDALTASQKIALVRVTQEALNNAAEHGCARNVSVRLSSTRARLSLEIDDDGEGFEVEQELLRAARAGRLGLVGMGERIRLLGGRFDIDSRPGGPTTVRATVPRWSPLTGKVEGA